MSVISTGILPTTTLETFRSRAAGYDRENRFFQEDFDDLRQAGYLRMAVPKELGGLGFSLADVARETRSLASYAPATALGMNMHNYWVGVASELWRNGDRSCEWILREAAAGEVFAAGHAESGNETSVVMSITKAERVDGGYKFTGRKSFGSLTPVWTRLGLHGLDTSDPAAPKVVHAFLPRDAGNFSIKETWDVLGMRATRSDDTVLDGAFVPDKYIARVVPMGFAGADLFVLSSSPGRWSDSGTSTTGWPAACWSSRSNLVKSRSSIALTRSMAYHPEVQHDVAEMVMELEAIGAQLETVARDWSEGVKHPDWPIKIVAAKYRAVEGAWRIVDRAMDVSGGFGMFKKSELERLFRDARAGRFHPANSALSHEVVGKLALGINPDETPRWG